MELLTPELRRRYRLLRQVEPSTFGWPSLLAFEPAALGLPRGIGSRVSESFLELRMWLGPGRLGEGDLSGPFLPTVWSVRRQQWVAQRSQVTFQPAGTPDAAEVEGATTCCVLRLLAPKTTDVLLVSLGRVNSPGVYDFEALAPWDIRVPVLPPQASDTGSVSSRVTRHGPQPGAPHSFGCSGGRGGGRAPVSCKRGRTGPRGRPSVPSRCTAPNAWRLLTCRLWHQLGKQPCGRPMQVLLLREHSLAALGTVPVDDAQSQRVANALSLLETLTSTVRLPGLSEYMRRSLAPRLRACRPSQGLMMCVRRRIVYWLTLKESGKSHRRPAPCLSAARALVLVRPALAAFPPQSLRASRLSGTTSRL